MIDDVLERGLCQLKSWSLRSPVVFCLSAFLFSRLLFWLLAFSADVYLGFPLQPQHFFYHYDSFWYQDIAIHGYSAVANFEGHVNYVFFPLLPLVVGVLSQLTHISVGWMGQIFCQCCFGLSLWLFYKVVQLRISEDAARWGVIILAFSPFNIYFSSFYTESLFLVLSLGVWFAAYRGRWLVVGMLAALLSATRPNGVMMIVPLLYFIFQAFRDKALKPSMLFVVLAPLGALIYMSFLYVHFGDALAFLHNEQASWHRSGWNFHVFFLQLGYNYLHFPYDTLVFFIATLLIVRTIRAKYWPEAIYFVIMLWPALSSGSFMSLARFSGCLFTFYFALVLITKDKPCLRYVLFSLFLALSGVYVYAWLTPSPFLM
jgi:Gpi18-like mannosyltransferase